LAFQPLGWEVKVCNVPEGEIPVSEMNDCNPEAVIHF
jgi:hypothetical protein